MEGCGTYQVLDIELTKEEKIDNLARIVKSIRPLLKKYEDMENNGYKNSKHIMTQKDFSNLWYYKYKNLHFYHELLEKLDGDKNKLEEVVKNWKPNDGITFL